MDKRQLNTATAGIAASVSRSPSHSFSKDPCASVFLRQGAGVDGDAHAGTTVQHRSRVRADPTQPNLRQVHLIAIELLKNLRVEGFSVAPGDLGENITTEGLDLLGLPRGALLRIGPAAVVEVTGLRNPCRQIESFQPGLLKAVLPRDAAGRIRRRAGVMGVVLQDGLVSVRDAIRVELPAGQHLPLERV